MLRLVYSLLFLLLTMRVEAQCTYASRQNGSWNDPNTWKPTGTACAAIPGPEAIVTISHDVLLNSDVQSLAGGSITIAATGSLVQDQTSRALTLGDGTGSQVTRLTQAGRLVVSSLAINKSDIAINAGASTTVYCNLTQSNQSAITLNGDLNLVGTLNITTGNVSANGTGRMRIGGCVSASNGGFNNYNSTLTICVQGNTAQNCGPGSSTCSAGSVPINNDAACRLVLPVLPVTLIYARATWQAKPAAVQLQWATATEEGNQSFIIERSANGREFSPLATVAGAGNSQTVHTYTHLDTQPLAARLSYYRLRQTDHDGTSSYSPVMAVKAGSNGVALELAPTSEGVYRPVVPGLTGAGQLAVYTPEGGLLSTYAISDQTELPLVDLRRASPGVYIVRAFTPGGTATQRLVR